MSHHSHDILNKRGGEPASPALVQTSPLSPSCQRQRLRYIAPVPADSARSCLFLRFNSLAAETLDGRRPRGAPTIESRPRLVDDV